MKTGQVVSDAGRVITDLLSYNRAERRGITVLCLLLLSLVVTGIVIPGGTATPDPDLVLFEKEVRDFENAWRRAADSDSMARLRNYNGKQGIRYALYGRGYDSTRKMSRPVVVIELNSADTLDLQQLRGIGPGFARRIVWYRDRLRGYCDKRQLLEVTGMDTARYQAIEGNLRVDRDSLRPFDLNTATFKELLRHPYFPFPVTKRIMLYRQQCKRFKSTDELRQIPGMSDSLFRRMVPYVRVGH